MYLAVGRSYLHANPLRRSYLHANPLRRAA